MSHTVEVTSATLYEAVALGIAAIRADDWVVGIAPERGEGLCYGRSRRARSQADGFHEVAGKDGRFAAGSE